MLLPEVTRVYSVYRVIGHGMVCRGLVAQSANEEKKNIHKVN